MSEGTNLFLASSSLDFGLAWQSNGEAFHSIDLRTTRPKPEGAATNRLIFLPHDVPLFEAPPTFKIKFN
jgi:hypothetical protein